MGTLITVLVLILFLTAIFTGGYNRDFLNRMRKNRTWDWFTTVDHKKIGILYFMSGFFFFLLAGLQGLLLRLQLVTPGNDLFVGTTYNEIFTMHGTTMMFFAALPMLFGLMNVIVPLQIGARDVAFPFVNALGFWLFFAGGLLLNFAWIFGEAPDAGWTGYPPLSLDPYSPHPRMDYYVMGLQISGIGSLISGINFIVTIINMRAPGMSFLRMPLFTWTTFVTSVLILFAFPALTAGLLLLMFERLFGAHFFYHPMGGSSLIWEHVFWIFGHPEVYILILPGFGIISDVVSTFSKKRLFGYNSMVFATVLIGFLGFMVWVHHMFTVGLGPVSNTVFGIASMAIAVPTGIKVFNWLFTMWGGEIRFKTAMLFAIGLIPTFVIGGMTGVMVSLPAADLQYHDSYFLVAHFHYALVGGTILSIFAGIYYWWPKMFGTLLNEKLGKLHFWTFLIGIHLTFFPQHFLGLFGMPRRVFTYNSGVGLETNNLISTVGTIFMTIGMVAFVVNIFITMKKQVPAGADPWNGRTLEWAIPSPPPEYNFLQVPLVRGLDAWWLEKIEGNKKLKPSEPIGSIHMPSPSYLPLIMSIGFFVSGLGFIAQDGNYIMGFLGLAIVAIAMFKRSFEYDKGYHIDVTKLEVENNGV